MDRAILTTTTGRLTISKSKFLAGSQCKKLLWHAVHTPDQIPEPDAAQQAIFDQGKLVGALARSLYPGDIEVSAGVTDFEQMLQNSLEATHARKPLFEAGFVYNGGFARVDILNPVGKDEWDIIEVKSSTEVKAVNILDLAFQAFVYNGAGLNIRRCFIMHVDRDFIRNGSIDPRKFFKLVDVTQRVTGVSREIEFKLEDMFGVIRSKQAPDIKIGRHCNDPYVCPLREKCWAFLPEQNVTTLYRGGKKAFKLLDEGILAVKDIPDDYGLTKNQKIQQEAVVTGEPHVDRPALASFLSQLKYPLSFLDFETYATAIPLFDGVHPYEQVPFQFSLHVVRAPGAKPEHIMFLAEGRHDPRRQFMLKLRDAIGRGGSIVAYNASFELSRLRECCEAIPGFTDWLKDIETLVVDLLDPFRSFAYYHPDQQGSASIKAVLPALTGKGYGELTIQAGDVASREFLRVTFGVVSDAERQKVRQQLEEYCGQDTHGMVLIVDALRRAVGSVLLPHWA